ncbi:hypothetical protein ScPMuIL_015419 [Solemya velum]
MTGRLLFFSLCVTHLWQSSEESSDICRDLSPRGVPTRFQSYRIGIFSPSPSDECWLLQADADQVVMVNLMSYTYGDVLFYDGYTVSDVVLGSYTTTDQLPKGFASTQQYMLIKPMYFPLFSHIEFTYRELPIAPPSCVNIPYAQIRVADDSIQYLESGGPDWGRVTTHSWLIIKPAVSNLTFTVLGMEATECDFYSISLDSFTENCKTIQDRTVCPSEESIFHHRGRGRFMLVTYNNKIVTSGTPFRLSYTTACSVEKKTKSTPVAVIASISVVCLLVVITLLMLPIIRRRNAKQRMNRAISGIRASQRRHIENGDNMYREDTQVPAELDIISVSTNDNAANDPILSVGPLSAGLPNCFAVIPISRVYYRNTEFDESVDLPSYDDAISKYMISQMKVFSISQNGHGNYLNGENQVRSDATNNVKSHRNQATGTDASIMLERPRPVELAPPRYQKHVFSGTLSGRLTPPPEYDGVKTHKSLRSDSNMQHNRSRNEYETSSTMSGRQASSNSMENRQNDNTHCFSDSSYPSCTRNRIDCQRTNSHSGFDNRVNIRIHEEDHVQQPEDDMPTQQRVRQNDSHNDTIADVDIPPRRKMGRKLTSQVQCDQTASELVLRTGVLETDI